MISEDTLIWTKYGWQRYYDLAVGDSIISYNSELNHCEYDKITSINTEYKQEMFYEINHKGMKMCISQDHDINVFNLLTYKNSKIPIKDMFGKKLIKKQRVLYNRPFKPYDRSQDMEDVAWSARVCASYGSIDNFNEYPYEILNIIKELTGPEAREWIDTFYHWSLKRMASPNWMFNVCLRNKMVRDMIFHVAPRAGVGAWWASLVQGQTNKNVMNASWGMRISNLSDASIQLPYGWGKRAYQNVAYNISTGNGTFLARRKGGTFLMSCNTKEV